MSQFRVGLELMDWEMIIIINIEIFIRFKNMSINRDGIGANNDNCLYLLGFQ